MTPCDPRTRRLSADYRARHLDRAYRTAHGLGLEPRTREGGASLRLPGKPDPGRPLSGPSLRSASRRRGLLRAVLFFLAWVPVLAALWWADVSLETLVKGLLALSIALTATAIVYAAAEGRR